MSFARVLGAGLLGGTANAAKGIGDRIRAEAKQKREFALQDRADKKAKGLADTANDRAVEAAKVDRIARAQRDRINNAALINRDNNSGRIRGDLQDDSQEFTGGQNADNRKHQVDLQDDSQEFTGGQNTDNRKHQVDLQDDSQEFTGGQNADNRKHQVDLQDDQQAFTGGQNASNKPMTDVQLQSHVTAQGWKHVGGKVDKYGEPEPLSPEDSKLVAGWNKKAFTKIQQLKDDGVAITPAVVSSVVAETFVRPFDVTKIKLTQDDRAEANKRYDSEASTMESDISQFGMSESQIKRQWATENAIRRQPDFIKAQKKYDEFVAAGTDPSDVFEMMRELNFDPDLLIKKKTK